MDDRSNKSAAFNSPLGGWGGLDVWKFILNKLSVDINVMLLYVLESEGSSPGRQGFKMAIAADGHFYGTIGGGMMEHKLVEKAKEMLKENETSVSLMRQYHDKENSRNQSGMICSGSQLNVFIPLSFTDKPIIETIAQGAQQAIQLSPTGLSVHDSFPKDKRYDLQFKSEEDWLYTEKINQQPVIHIIGGGHVSLALCELMSFLGFFIKVYDDRPRLNTMQENNFANEKYFIEDYRQLDKTLHATKDDFVVIITFGYRSDKIVLKELLDKELAYIGLIGSDNKIKTLFKELEEEGISPQKWQHVFAPIGINIFSKTAAEIAVSIAAEIIREKNKELPTGRSDN